MPSSPVNRTFNLALWTLALAFALPLSTLGLTLSVLLQLDRDKIQRQMESRAQTTSATQTTVLPATNGDLKAAARPPATSSRRVSYSMGSSKLEDVPELAESDHASEDDGGGPDTALAGIQGRRRLDADLKLISSRVRPRPSPLAESVKQEVVVEAKRDAPSPASEMHDLGGDGSLSPAAEMHDLNLQDLLDMQNMTFPQLLGEKMHQARSASKASETGRGTMSASTTLSSLSSFTEHDEAAVENRYVTPTHSIISSTHSPFTNKSPLPTQKATYFDRPTGQLPL